MTAIGIDTHKPTLAALAAWVGEVAPGATVGVEGSSSYGAPAARVLHAAGVDVREVPPHISRRERGRTRRPGKSDPGDALAIARVTLHEPTCLRCAWRTRARSWACWPTHGTSS